MMVTLPSKCKDISELLSSEHALEKKENQQCLVKYFQVCDSLLDKVAHFVVIVKQMWTATMEIFINFADFVQRTTKR